MNQMVENKCHIDGVVPATRASMSDYWELTKPRITRLILVSTGIGYYFGLGGPVSWWSVAHTLVGTAMIASGTAALNMWYERDGDALMHRTENRPIPSGRVTASEALWFGIAISIIGFLELALTVNLISALLGLFTLFTYLFVYTPLKRRSWHATTLGAIPGAMPPLIGFAAARGSLGVEAWALFAILFLWQFPHFYAIAWMYRADYSKAGIKMLPVVEPDGESTARQMMLTALLLIPVSLVPAYLGMAGKVYCVGAVLLGLAFFASTVRVAKDRTELKARHVLLTSVVYLPLIFGLLLISKSVL